MQFLDAAKSAADFSEVGWESTGHDREEDDEHDATKKEALHHSAKDFSEDFHRPTHCLYLSASLDLR